jgi:hypothetical protein
MESTMQQRRDEILAKKAKLAELKRQRELRKAETANRQSLSGSPLGEVGDVHQHARTATNKHIRSSHQHQDAAKTLTEGPMSPTSSIAFLGRVDPAPHNLALQLAQDEQHDQHP